MRYALGALAARAEIEDVVRLYCHATDRRRWDLMARVFHEDGTAQIASVVGPWKDFIDVAARTFEAHLDVTQHQIGNILISFDGDVAFTEVYCTAYHRVRADAPPEGLFPGTGSPYDFIGGLRYVDRFERRPVGWRIAERRGIPDWAHIQDARDGAFSALPAALRGQFGGADLGARATAGWTS